MPKHFFFDMDNTLTRSKSPIEPPHADILAQLLERADVVVVSGHPQKDIREHLKPLSNYYVLAQNGNYVEKADGSILWEHKLSSEQVGAIHAFIDKAKKHLSLKVKDENDLVEDRGCQVTYSLIGHHEDQDIKDVFDADHAKRRKLLEDLSADVKALEVGNNVEIKIAGTTGLDFNEKGKTKGYNIGEFIKATGWNKEDCIYVGDALFPGGNDETVIGVIPTRPVKGYRETYDYLASIL